MGAFEHNQGLEAELERVSNPAPDHVHRLYEARRLQAQQRQAAWVVVQVKPVAAVNVSFSVQQSVAASTVAMQARLGNGVALSWAHCQENAEARDSVLRVLAGLA